MRRRSTLAVLVVLFRLAVSWGDVSMEMLMGGGVVQQTGPAASFSLEAYAPKYVIGMALNSQFDEDDEAFVSAEGESESVEIADHNGKKFVCVFPKDVPDGTSAGGAPLIVKDKGRNNITELLAPLSTGCYYRVDGWWTYEFCHRKSIRQFHQEKDVVMSEFFLGYFDGAEASEHTAGDDGAAAAASVVSEAVSSTGGTQRFYAHQFTNGTECELTGEKRSTEVRFVCTPEAAGNGFVESINEHPTCHYVLIFASNLLCNHSAFTPEPPQVHQIKCRAVGGGGDGEDGKGGGGADGESAEEGSGAREVEERSYEAFGGRDWEREAAGDAEGDAGVAGSAGDAAGAGGGAAGSGDTAASAASRANGGTGGGDGGGDDDDEDEDEEEEKPEASIEEVVAMLEELGQRMQWQYDDEPDDDL